MNLHEEEPWGGGVANSSDADIERVCPVNTGFTEWFLPSVYLVVTLLGLLGNGLGLWNLCASSWKSGWSTLSVLMCNLGVADLLYVVTLPFLVAYYLQGRLWLFGREWCRLTRALFHLNLYASIGFLMCISVHRYLGIVYPLRMLGRCQTLSPAFLLSVSVWGWVVLQLSPDFVFSKMDQKGTRCHDTTGHEHLGAYLPYTLAVTMTGFVIPFLITIGCYCHVVVVLRRNSNVDPNLKRRSIRLAVLVMVLFSVCFLPYHVFRNLNLLSRKWQLQGSCTQTLKNIYVSYQVTRGLASLNSCLNPLLYLMANEDLVTRLKTFCRRQGHSQDFFVEGAGGGPEGAAFSPSPHNTTCRQVPMRGLPSLMGGHCTARPPAGFGPGRRVIRLLRSLLQSRANHSLDPKKLSIMLDDECQEASEDL